MRKEKSYWNLKRSRKQELDNYEIDQFQNILSNGKTYPLKILHGRMRILYRSTQSYSSIEDNTFFEGEGHVRSLYYQFSPLLLLVQPPYCYCCTPVTPILLLLCPYIVIVRSARIILWAHGLLYIEGGFGHFYHPRIVHLCNVLEVSPSKWLISKALISLFFYFWSWFHNTKLFIISRNTSTVQK